MSNKEDQKDSGSANAQTAGSPEVVSGPNPNDLGGGQPQNGASKEDEVDLGSYVPKQQHEELEKAYGKMSTETGEYRNFFREIEPLLETLEKQPELAEAIIAGKVKIEDAQEVKEAQEEVRKDMGSKNYDKASPEDIEQKIMKKVEEKLSSVTNTLKSDVSNVEDKRKFEDGINKFIENTPDFTEYADDITKWLDEHPSVADIDVAYYAVKGKKSVEQAKRTSEEIIAEEQKKLAANAAGGSSRSSQMIKDESVIDSLISGKSNPNTF